MAAAEDNLAGGTHGPGEGLEVDNPDPEGDLGADSLGPEEDPGGDNPDLAVGIAVAEAGSHCFGRPHCNSRSLPSAHHD